MRDYDDEIMAYEDDAESNYDDFDGYYEDDFDTGFEGNEDSYYDEDDYEEVEYMDEADDYEGYDDELYDSYKSTSICRINPNDRTLTVVVRNTSGADAEAILFGGFASEPQPAGVTVDVQESSHAFVRSASSSNPFLIQGLKLSVSDSLQFDNVLKLVRETAAGSNTERVYQPRNATSPANFTSTLIDDSSFSAEIGGEDSIRVVIRDGVTMVFTFTIKARANMSNLLKGQNVAEMSTAPRISGVPGIDLLRKGAKKPFGLAPKRRVRRVVRRARPTTNVRRSRRFTPRRRPTTTYLRRRR